MIKRILFIEKAANEANTGLFEKAKKESEAVIHVFKKNAARKTCRNQRT